MVLHILKAVGRIVAVATPLHSLTEQEAVPPFLSPRASLLHLIIKQKMNVHTLSIEWKIISQPKNSVSQDITIKSER